VWSSEDRLLRYVPYQPCLCLCFWFGQITRTTPRRRTILHLSHIRFTDARTFMIPLDNGGHGGNGHPQSNGVTETERSCSWLSRGALGCSVALCETVTSVSSVLYSFSTIRPRPRSTGDRSTRTRSPTRIRTKFRSIRSAMCAST